MATDLVAQKILSTDPQVGFGEGSVLPYRQHSLDTRGFEAMERAQTRRAAKEAELQKTNAHFFNERIGKLKEYDRMFAGLINKKTKEVLETGTRVIREGRGQLTGDNEFNQKFADRNALADGTMQMRKEYEDIEKADYGDYISKNDVVGAATRNFEKAALDAEDGDISAVSRSIKPNVNSFEFFKVDKFIYDKVKDIKMSEQSTDKKGYGGLGEYITTTSNGYKFATKDANGKLVAGVDKSIIDYFLNSNTTDPDTLRLRASMDNAADLEIENKALQILQNDPRFKTLRKDEVPEQLNKLKDQISYDQKSPFYEGIDAIKERILKDKLNPFQESKEKTDIKQGFKYDTDGDGAEAKKFKIEPTNIVRNTKNGLGVFAPGVSISKDGKPIPLSVAPTRIHDFNMESLDFGNIDQVPVSVTGVGYTLTNKDGSLVSFKDNESILKYINTAKKEDLNKLKLSHVLFGTIQEKKNTQSDTGKDQSLNSSGELVNEKGEIELDDEGYPIKPPKEETINRSVAIDYDPNGETGAMLNSMSGGKFKDRTLTPAEQAVKDAWDKRMTKKSTQVSKPDPSKKNIEGF